QLDTPFLQRLRAAGMPPEEVDIVLYTHLHADHVGWNTMLVDGRWVPTFPKRKVPVLAHRERDRRSGPQSGGGHRPSARRCLSRQRTAGDRGRSGGSFPDHFGAPHVARIAATSAGFCPQFVEADTD